MAGIDLAIAADTRSAMSAIQRGVLDPLEDVAEALEDMGREGERAGQDLVDSMRDAQRRSADAKDEIKEIREALDKAGRAGKDAGRDIERGMRDAESGVNEFKDEANSTAREAAASFDGSAESIGDAFQEVAANAFAGFGPAGAVAGIAAAAGLGVVLTELQKQQEAAQQLKQYFSEAYQAAAEEGRKYIDVATIQAEAFDILYNPDRQNEYNRAAEQGKQIGLDTNTVILARAGDQEALNVVLQATADKESEIKARAEEQGSTAIRLAQDERNELSQIQREYEGIGALHDENAQRATNAQAIRDTLQRQEREQINRTADLAAARYQGLADRYGVPIKGRVVLEVDDANVRNYRPPAIRGTLRLSPQLDQAV